MTKSCAAALMLVNVWFVLAGARFQGRHLDESPHFLASFHNLEHVYQSLRQDAGENRHIAVHDGTYALSDADRSHYFLDPYIIHYYVEAREKQTHRTPVPGDPSIYNLFAWPEGAPADPNAALAWKQIQLFRADQPAASR